MSQFYDIVPTMENYCRAYPNQIFTAIIFEEYRDDYVDFLENYYNNKNICVTGRIN